MAKAPTPRLVSVTPDNLAETGFFCLQSNQKTEGFQRKQAWLRQRLAEGMQFKMLQSEGRGFIEYIPSELAWRTLHAPGYMVIHCLWVIGQSKGRGFGSLLLADCVNTARQAGMRGVAMVTSSGNWLAGEELLLKRGFSVVDEAPPGFKLLALQFKPGPLPTLPKDWTKRCANLGKGLVVVRTDQCPYVDRYAGEMRELAAERGLKFREVHLPDAATLQATSPSPYGVFAILHAGRLLSYHPLLKKQVAQRLDETAG
ncbi:MAG: GNAT family N-acetyltransferase [Opitutaceae bacterium]|jgi:L-amino acid N-acyltransferase YncA|nr:GNAT family N-acetyltransferase [Opitutaceae bacterium]MBP9914123.1 GNAT family N-acetyltransferase [Opitutaceae bacterium]